MYIALATTLLYQGKCKKMLLCLGILYYQSKNEVAISGKAKTGDVEYTKPELLIGLITLIAILVLSIILIVTVVGAGVGVSITFLYGIAVYLSSGVVAYALTNTLIPKLNWKPAHKNVWYVLAVTLAMKQLTLIPFAGGLIMFAIVLTGFGLLFSFLFRKVGVETA